MTVYRLFNFLILSLFAGIAYGQSDHVAAALKVFMADPSLRSGQVSFLAVNAKTGAEIGSAGANTSLIPASVMKVVTTAAAMDQFGPDHRFITRLVYTGKLDTSSGVLEGNLVIIGGGDPSLGSSLFSDNPSAFLNVMSAAVKSAGITKVNGAVIADDRIFPGHIPPGWSWDDLGNYYGAWATGISVFDNQYEILFRSGKTGEAVDVLGVEPCLDGIKIKSEVTAGGRTDNAYIFGAPYAWERVVRGTVPPSRNEFRVKGSIPDPALALARIFHQTLEVEGIRLSHQPALMRDLPSEFSDTRQTELLTLQSPRLEEIIKQTNIKSLNPYAETLLNHLGLKLKGNAGYDESTEAVKQFWAGKGVNTDGMFMNDGSGLSRLNGLNAGQLVAMLRYMYGSRYFNSFYSTLPVAGRDGSLSSLMRGTYAEGNMRAKSGYLTRVRSYAGYVKNNKGEDIIFAIIINNYTSTPYQMKIKIQELLTSLTR